MARRHTRGPRQVAKGWTANPYGPRAVRRRPGGTITAAEYDQAMGPNSHFGRAGVHSAAPPPPPPPPPPRAVTLAHEMVHSDPPTSSGYRGHRGFAVGAPMTPAEACTLARMLRAHGYRVKEPSMQVGAPVTAHDAEAVARILEDHGYTVGRPSRRARRKKKKRKGLLVGLASALTGGRVG